MTMADTMPIRRSITRRLVDTTSTTSLSGRMRQQRWLMLRETFPELPSMRVLDLGGVASFWRRDPRFRPAHVTLANLFPQVPPEPWMAAVEADGCSLPADLGTFDLVVSNSVIEHVGGHHRREQFAAEVRRSASSYWVQTPYRYFPIEPHFLFPFFQHVPRSAQASIAAAWPVGNFGAQHAGALGAVLDIELVSRTEMRHYFPDATIVPERIAGLTKSLIAVRR